MTLSKVTKEKFVLAYDGKDTYIGYVDQSHESRVRVDYFGDLSVLVFYEVEWLGSPWTDGWKDDEEVNILTFDVVDWT